MKTTNKTTSTRQNTVPTEPTIATTDTHPPSESSHITPATRRTTRRITEVSKPVVEIIACFANCAGFPRLFPNLEEPNQLADLEDRIEYIFDLKDHRTGRLYKSLFAHREGDAWCLPFLFYVNQGASLPLLSALEAKPLQSKYSM